MVWQTTSSKLPNAAIHAEPLRSQDYAEKTETIVVHLPTGKRDGHSFSELRLETLAHDGLATSALGPLYTGQNEQPAWIQAPLFEYPLFSPPPRVAFRMPGPVPWFIAETAAECLGTDKQYKPSHVPGHARSAIQLRKHSVGQKCSPVIGWTANDRAIGWTSLPTGLVLHASPWGPGEPAVGDLRWLPGKQS